MHTVSFSRLKAYEECPRRYWHVYVHGDQEEPKPYFSFGSSVHKALEALVRPVTEGRDYEHLPDEEALIAAYNAAWERDGYKSQEEESFSYEEGKEILLTFRRKFVEEKPKPILVEQELSAPLPGTDVVLHGFLDRIDVLPDGSLEVLDYKTTKKLGPKDAETSEQLTIYQALVEANYQLPVTRLSLYDLRKGKAYVSSPRGRDEVLRVVKRVVSVVDCIEAGKFEPTPGQWCARCEFRGACPAWQAVTVG